MNFELPLYGQEKRNSCALACLRMVLAAFGTDVSEATIEAQTELQEEGLLIDELELLARRFNLVAEIQDTTIEELREILAAGKLAICFIDRAIFDLSPTERLNHSIRSSKMHTVIPIHLSVKSITFHDPLFPAVTRRSIRVFRQAYQKLGGRSVVCSKAK